MGTTTHFHRPSSTIPTNKTSPSQNLHNKSSAPSYSNALRSAQLESPRTRLTLPSKQTRTHYQFAPPKEAISFHRTTSPTTTKRSARQQIHLRYMYLTPHANDLRHQPPLELQPFRIPRKPCSPYFSSNG